VFRLNLFLYTAPLALNIRTYPTQNGWFNFGVFAPTAMAMK